MEDKKHNYPVHRTLQGIVESGLHASIREVLQILSEDESIGIISKVVHAETVEGARTAMNECLQALLSKCWMDVVAQMAAVHTLTVAETSSQPACRAASRTTAKDIVLGSYDAFEEEQAKVLSKPHVKYFLLPAGALLASLFFVPLCLCLWRFALYGPGPWQ